MGIVIQLQHKKATGKQSSFPTLHTHAPGIFTLQDQLGTLSLHVAHFASFVKIHRSGGKLKVFNKSTTLSVLGHFRPKVWLQPGYPQINNVSLAGFQQLKIMM